MKSVSLSVTGGEVVAVTGPNGSGKSTLLKVVAGLLRPTRGSVSLSVGGAKAADVSARRRFVGYAAPDLMLYPELTAIENLQFFGAMRGQKPERSECVRILNAIGLKGRGDDPVGAYSSGMRQRMRLAFAQWGSPPVLLLDEPSLALDERGIAVVADMISAQRASGGLTLLATNDPREAALGERTIVLGG